MPHRGSWHCTMLGRTVMYWQKQRTTLLVVEEEARLEEVARNVEVAAPGGDVAELLLLLSRIPFKLQ